MTQDVFVCGNNPKKREYEKYGKTAETYDFIGRVHLDSLELYRKYTYEERHTYSLTLLENLKLVKRKLFMKVLSTHFITMTLKILNTTDKTLHYWTSWTKN